MGTPGGHMSHPLPPLLPQAQHWQSWSRTGRRAAGVAVGPCTHFPFFPPKCRRGWGPLLPSPPDSPSSPRRPRAVQRRIPGRILPGPSRAPLPSWVSDTGHPKRVLHPTPPCTPRVFGVLHSPHGIALFLGAAPHHPLPRQPPRGSRDHRAGAADAQRPGAAAVARRGETGDRGTGGTGCGTPSGWGSGCPLLTPRCARRSPPRAAKPKISLASG